MKNHFSEYKKIGYTGCGFQWWRTFRRIIQFIYWYEFWNTSSNQCGADIDDRSDGRTYTDYCSDMGSTREMINGSQTQRRKSTYF